MRLAGSRRFSLVWIGRCGSPRWAIINPTSGLSRFVLRLLQGSPAVVGLLEKNPFPARPPRYIRALLYDYSFTDIETLRRTGTWWRRETVGAYLPSVGLKEVASAP